MSHPKDGGSNDRRNEGLGEGKTVIKTATRGQNQLAGIMLALGALFLFSLLDVQAKYLGQTLPVSQVVWARYFGHFAVMAVIFMPRRGVGLFRTRRPGLQLVRSILLLLCTAAFFTAIQYMPLADAVSISFVSPLLVTALSVPLLGEVVGPRRWSAVAVGFRWVNPVRNRVWATDTKMAAMNERRFGENESSNFPPESEISLCQIKFH